MNCGLNAGKQEKQTKKINPSFADSQAISLRTT
jgi:hypothetical protein